MLFYVKDFPKCFPRLGKISEVYRIPNFELETPTALLYTKAGSIPHITKEVLQLITDKPQGIQLPFASTESFCESLSNTRMTLAEFIGLKEYLVYVTVQDPGDITPGMRHKRNEVPIWTRSGQRYITSESYIDTMKDFLPDMLCLLSDSDTNKASAQKRIHKSVTETIMHLNKCLDRLSQGVNCSDTMTIIAPVVGGYCLNSRDLCLKAILKHEDKFGGYLITGLHNNGPELEFLPFGEVQPIVEHVINQLPERKFRIVEGCWNPVDVIKLIRLGVDIFDTSYIHLLVERTSALTFTFDSDNKTLNNYEINLTDSKFDEDFTPLVQGCKCLACAKYTRAYIHHLITVSELLGPTLLTIHNTHHYLEFFKAIRQSMRNGTLDILESLVQEQFNSHNKQINGSKPVDIPMC
ncbi:uncharacterized protein CBL_11988 [Carabus blaptoides fortunei]